MVCVVFQPPSGIRPQMFKTLIGRGHPEFSTKRQQDAQEFLLHLLSELEVCMSTVQWKTSVTLIEGFLFNPCCVNKIVFLKLFIN